MRWLTTGRSHGTDRGAAALLIAILLPVFMLIVAGLVVDVGSWYAIRAQSQNGADAAALAIAQSCASGACDTSLASTYSAANSNGNIGSGGATYRLVCGSAPNADPSLTSCADPSIPPNPCPGAPSSGAGYVNVQTISNNAIGVSGGIPGMDTLFDSAKTKVAACAQATWGSPPPTSGIALTVSYCSWQQAVGGDGSNPVYQPQPPYPPYPPASAEYLFYFHGGAPGKDTKDQACATPNSSGQQVPGGFGHTCEVGAGNCSQTGTSCATDLTSLPNDWYGSNTGNAIDSLCVTALEQAWASRQPVLLPVFDCVSSVSACLTKYPCSSCSTGGNNAAYHLQSLAAFVVTAYHWQTAGGGNKDEYSWIPGSAYASTRPCTGSNSCLVGFFTTAVVSSGGTGGGTSTGVSTISLSG